MSRSAHITSSGTSAPVARDCASARSRAGSDGACATLAKYSFRASSSSGCCVDAAPSGTGSSEHWSRSVTSDMSVSADGVARTLIRCAPGSTHAESIT